MNNTVTEKEMEQVHGLAHQQCTACQGGVPALKGTALETLYRQLDHDWQVINEHHLEKEFSFEDFKQALDFTNRVGAIAEEQNHHPDIYLTWGKVRITLWTHKVDGLTENDFIVAAKIQNAL